VAVVPAPGDSGESEFGFGALGMANGVRSGEEFPSPRTGVCHQGTEPPVLPSPRSLAGIQGCRVRSSMESAISVEPLRRIYAGAMIKVSAASEAIRLSHAGPARSYARLRPSRPNRARLWPPAAGTAPGRQPALGIEPPAPAATCFRPVVRVRLFRIRLPFVIEFFQG